MTKLNVRIEHLRDAFGIGINRPRLSWIVETETQGWRQVAYEIEVYDAAGNLRGQTGRVESDRAPGGRLSTGLWTGRKPAPV